MSTEKGSFSADIGQEVIEAAMRSVDRASGENVVVESAPEADPTAAAASIPEQTADQKEIESLKAQLEFSTAKGRELMEKIKDAHERMLRAVADLDNYKKRAAKEKEEVQKFGTEKLLKDFLPVADNLDRALDHAKNATDLDGFKKGVEMVRKQLDDTLGKHGVRAFSALGQLFDPRLHEAIQQQESADVAPNTVVNELVRGYTLHERLVRPSLVVVAKAPAAAAPVAGGGDPGEVKG